MGLNPYTQVVYGVRIPKRATEGFSKWKKEIHNSLLDDPVLMMIIEGITQFEKDTDWQEELILQFSKYLKIDRRKKTKRLIRPYRTFWSDYKQSDIEKMKSGYFYSYFEKHIKSIPTERPMKINYSNEPYNKIILPDNQDIENFIGFKYGEENYGRDVDWALSSVLNLSPEGGLIEVPGTRPWETGTTEVKKEYMFKTGATDIKKNLWFTFNGEHMFPLPYKRIPNDIKNLLCSFSGTKKQYVEAKKKAYYQLCPDKKAYYNHENELWGWSAIIYTIADYIYEFLSNQIPEIKYDYLKLKKYIALYWR